MLVFEEQGEKLLRQVEPLVDEQHQQLVCQFMGELRAAARATLTHGFGFHDDRFALVLLVLKDFCELRQECLKLLQIHSCNSQELFRASTKFVIEGHKFWKLNYSLAYRATGLMSLAVTFLTAITDAR